MTPDEIEAVAHRWHLEVVPVGKLEVVDEILTPEVVVHANGQEVRGADGTKQRASVFPIAFPDLPITHHAASGLGKRVAIRWTADATQRGDDCGIPPSGQRIPCEGLACFHVHDGQIAARWLAYDQRGPLQQPGALAQPSATRAVPGCRKTVRGP